MRWCLSNFEPNNLSKWQERLIPKGEYDLLIHDFYYGNFFAQKIERVKELLVYGELNLNEIADMLNYSSAAHLSAQFKKNHGTHIQPFQASKRE